MSQKIFSITVEMDLIVKPDWLEGFRKKYDYPYKYHLSLKTKSYLNESKLDEIKEKLFDLAEESKVMRVVFDKVSVALSSKGWCIMLNAEENEQLKNFQKYISEEFAKYGANVSSQQAEYEKDFHPHITIARYLDEEICKKAESEVGVDIHCEGVIKDLVIAVVDKDLSEKWSDEKNRTVFKLKQ